MHSLIILSCLVTGIFANCDFPPNLWCASKEISKLCRVEEQCKEYVHSEANAAPVNFTLYYESLCPDCQLFFQNQFFKAYEKIGMIMNISLVPYGNAYEKPGSKPGEWDFQCQHGVQECRGNVIETCTIFVEKKVDNYFPFIYCMEISTTLPDQSAKLCSTKYKVNLDRIMSCANGTVGNSLEHQMALKTNRLDPPHKYVPWVTLNGVHTEKIQKKAENDLISLICDTYTGTKPSACSKVDKPNRCWKY